MNTRKLLVVASVCLVAAFANNAAADDTSHEVLAHWVGHWTGGVAGAESKPDGFVGKPNLADAQWTLDNKYVQGTNSDASGKPIGVWMLHYDDHSGKYEVWYFTAASGVRHWYGVWSDADSTMTWTGDDAEAGAKLAGYTRFDGDEQSWKLSFEKDGKVTTDTGSLHKK
jgi:hypothetical protein